MASDSVSRNDGVTGNSTIENAAAIASKFGKGFRQRFDWQTEPADPVVVYARVEQLKVTLLRNVAILAGRADHRYLRFLEDLDLIARMAVEILDKEETCHACRRARIKPAEGGTRNVE